MFQDPPSMEFHNRTDIRYVIYLFLIVRRKRLEGEDTLVLQSSPLESFCHFRVFWQVLFLYTGRYLKKTQIWILSQFDKKMIQILRFTYPKAEFWSVKYQNTSIQYVCCKIFKILEPIATMLVDFIYFLYVLNLGLLI